MAVDGKILAEIERMFYLVGILQEHISDMSKQMMTLIPETSSSADCKEDLNEKESTAAEPEMITKEEKTKQEKEKVKLENTNQNLTSAEYKQGDYWIKSTTNLRKMQKTKVEALEAYGMQEFKIKKYNWGLHIDSDSDYDLEDPCLVEILQQLSLNIPMGRDYGRIAIELFRDLMTDIKDYQQDRRRGTVRDLRASDVRNPG